MPGSVATSLLLAALLAGSGWTSARHDPHNTGSVRLETSDGGVPRAWTFRTGRHVWGYQPGMTVWSSPAIFALDGRALVAAGSYDRNVYVLDASTGEKVWRFTTGAGVYATPATWFDGANTWLFAASSDRLVYALDARTGRRRWSTPVETYRPTIGGARLSSPCVGFAGAEPAVFVGHWVWDKSLKHNLQRGGLTALSAREGKKLWTTTFLDNQVGDPVCIALGETRRVFVGSRDGNLRALDADTGEVLWHHRETEPIMGAPAWTQTPDGQRVFIGSHFGKLRCLDAGTGREIWAAKTGNWITGAPAVARVDDRDVVIFGSYDQRVYALDAATGERLWSHPTGGPVYASPAVVPGEDPVVVIASFDHSLYALDARDGTLIWSVFTGAPIWSAVTLGESNWSSPSAAWVGDRWMVYFGSYAGTFYALPLNQAAQVGPSRPWSNLRFWVTMGIAMLFTAAVAWYLSRRKRTGELP